MNLANMVVDKALSQMKPDIKKVFFYRICGTGMGACACLAKEAGFEVVGADLTYSPPMSTYLESQDIKLLDLNKLSKDDLKDVDLVIVGNSVPRNSEYARFLEDCGIPFTSFPSFLGEFILKEKEVIGLCGTHGKTTTTFFLTQMLEELGEDPGYFVGGIINGRPPSKLGTGKYFCIESDEYDSAYFQKISKFRLYELNHMILTSLEFDHADIFSSVEDIKNEFKPTITELNGNIVANDAYVAIDELVENFPQKPWLRYGETTANGPTEILVKDSLSYFKLKLGNSLVNFETNIIGEHNILNISGCLLLLHSLGFNTLELQNSVKNLGMVKRRQEERGYYNEMLVIDDFAHHPKAIDLTIDAIKSKYPDKKLVTVFEPVSATARSAIFQSEFVESLLKSPTVIIAQSPIKTTVEGADNLDTNQLVLDLSKRGIHSEKVEDLDELLKSIDQIHSKDSLLLVLSNRTCLGLWESSFVEKLKN